MFDSSVILVHNTEFIKGWGGGWGVHAVTHIRERMPHVLAVSKAAWGLGFVNRERWQVYYSSGRPGVWFAYKYKCTGFQKTVCDKGVHGLSSGGFTVLDWTCCFTFTFSERSGLHMTHTPPALFLMTVMMHWCICLTAWLCWVSAFL